MFVLQVFFLRDGMIVGREHFILNDEADQVPSELIEEFIKRFYGGVAFIPKTIYVPFINEFDILEQWLSSKKESKVMIKIPQKGEKKKTLEMVGNNAKITLENFKVKDKQDKEVHKIALNEIVELLELDEIPQRIESYDISNIMGVDSVGSMVVFEDGKPKTSDYRRFKIKSVIGANDYDSMREILERRFIHGLEEVEKIKERNLELSKGKFCIFPDLILMDGGKGQVNVALEVLNSLNINIPVCGMVKDDKHKTRGLIYNNIELNMRSNSQSMHLITRIQDEVHRFAITYHRTLRDKRTLYSILDNIPNIGQKRRRELLKKFGSIDNIKTASSAQLMETPSIDSKAAQCVIEYFKNGK